MAKQIKVPCECDDNSITDADCVRMREILATPVVHRETISSLAEKIFEGAKNLEVLINENPIDLLNFAPSAFSAKPCPACEGRGWNHQANGPDDYDKEECAACSGTGKLVVANNN